MKTLLQKLVITTIVVFTLLTYQNTNAQAVCGAGFTKAAINWDWQYYHQGRQMPSSPINYMFGKNIMRFAWSGTNTFIGIPVIDQHSGSAGSLAPAGYDAKYVVGNGADTLVFDSEVTNFNMSVFDVDNGQALRVNAYNSLNVLQNVTLARVSGTSLAPATQTGTNPTITATAANVLLTSSNGTANITIAGPINRVILIFTKAAGSDSVYISDITACNNNATTGVWPNGYQAVNTPEIGEPSYMLAAYKDSIILINTTANTSSLLYRDVALSAFGINSLAIDPYRQEIYYTNNQRSFTNTSIFKYNIRTGVRTTWIANVTAAPFNMILSANGLGSGGAAFYDGALFMGADVTDTVNNAIATYRFNLDANGNATKASRYWSKFAHNGVGLQYDWSDFVINNGILYNFNNANFNPARTGTLHFDLNIMDTLRGYVWVSRAQLSLDYTGAIWHMLSGNRELYSPATGTFGASIPYSGTTGSVVIDAAESFKYPYDFGDAPLTYGVAFHLYRTSPNLLIGASLDYEVNDTIAPTASGDDLVIPAMSAVDDEEGVTTFPSLTTANASYTVPVRTTNSSGAAATISGYLDFNRDGDFADAGETSAAAVVPNGSTPATPINVVFTGLTGGSVGASFIRFRLATSAAEAGNRFGYAATGEVEDYPIPISASSLPVELVDFTATTKEKTTLLNWSTASEFNNDYFEVQRKNSNNTWEAIGKVKGVGFSNNLNTYDFLDKTPNNGVNYYQLKQVDFDAKMEYSPMVSVTFDDKTDIAATALSLYPNPTTNDIWIKSDQPIDAENLLDIEVLNITGEKLHAYKMQENIQKINLSEYQNGMYFIKIGTKTYRVIKQ